MITMNSNMGRISGLVMAKHVEVSMLPAYHKEVYPEWGTLTASILYSAEVMDWIVGPERSEINHRVLDSLPGLLNQLNQNETIDDFKGNIMRYVIDDHGIRPVTVGLIRKVISTRFEEIQKVRPFYYWLVAHDVIAAFTYDMYSIYPEVKYQCLEEFEKLYSSREGSFSEPFHKVSSSFYSKVK